MGKQRTNRGRPCRPSPGGVGSGNGPSVSSRRNRQPRGNSAAIERLAAERRDNVDLAATGTSVTGAAMELASAGGKSVSPTANIVGNKMLGPIANMWGIANGAYKLANANGDGLKQWDGASDIGLGIIGSLGPLGTVAAGAGALGKWADNQFGISDGISDWAFNQIHDDPYSREVQPVSYRENMDRMDAEFTAGGQARSTEGLDVDAKHSLIMASLKKIGGGSIDKIASDCGISPSQIEQVMKAKGVPGW